MLHTKRDNRVREKDRKTLREKVTKRERVRVRVKVKGKGQG